MTKHLSSLLLTSILIAGSPALAQLPQRVSDLNPLKGNTSPRNLTSFNNKLYFSADDGNTGRELWSYDGSANQPTLVADLAPGTVPGMAAFGGAIPDPSFPVLNGKMYLLAYPPSASGKPRLFSYDGANPPAPAPGIADSVLLSPSDFITFGNRIFFTAGTKTTIGMLHAYDGLSAPTVYPLASPHAFTPYNGKLYFVATADFATIGYELYVYDPATDQCSLAADINPGAAGSSCRGLTVAGNKMYFAATIAGYGRELCQYDGTTVTRLTDLAPGGTDGVYSVSAYSKGNIIFSGATDGVSYLPYKHNVSSGQIARISSDSSIYSSGWGTEYMGNLYFACGNGIPFVGGVGTELWKYDGTHLSMLPEIWPGWKDSRPDNYRVHNGSLYFTAEDSTYGNELYRLYDPTSVLNTRFDGELKLFPNPAATHATLELTLNSLQQLSVSLIDMTGREVFTRGTESFESGKSKIVIPLQALACGSYSYQLMDGSGRRVASGILIKE